MKYTLFVALLLVFGGAAFYFGRKSATDDVTQNFINNVSVVKQIAELSSLSVQGTTTVKVSNSGTGSTWTKFKNFFNENTLLVTVPYVAKFGLNLAAKQVAINSKEKIVSITLPSCKMLSLQLELDKIVAMNKTGLFASTSIEEFSKAQQQLYKEATQTLSSNTEYLKSAQVHIEKALQEFYKPLGYVVNCTFKD